MWPLESIDSPGGSPVADQLIGAAPPDSTSCRSTGPVTSATCAPGLVMLGGAAAPPAGNTGSEGPSPSSVATTYEHAEAGQCRPDQVIATTTLSMARAPP